MPTWRKTNNQLAKEIKHEKDKKFIKYCSSKGLNIHHSDIVTELQEMLQTIYGYEAKDDSKRDVYAFGCLKEVECRFSHKYTALLCHLLLMIDLIEEERTSEGLRLLKTTKPAREFLDDT